jgi:hypothetical protein
LPASATPTERQANKLSPKAEATVDFVLQEQKDRNAALSILKSYEDISPQRLEEISRTFTNTQDLIVLAAAMSSDDPVKREQARAVLGLPSNPDDVKKIEENKERSEYLIDRGLTDIAAVAAVVAIAGETAHVSATTGAATPAAPAVETVTPEVKAAAAKELAAVLPEVSPEIVMSVPDADTLGTTLFGRSFSGNRNWGSLKSEISAAAPAPSSAKPKSVADQVLSNTAPPIAASSVVPD